MTEKDIVKDTEFKIKDILKRYHEIKNSIEILEDQIMLLEELLQSDDLTNLIEQKTGMGRYNNDSIVEKEVFFKEKIQKAIELKRREIKDSIIRLKDAARTKKRIINQIDNVLNSNALDKNERFLLKYYYIDKKINNDKASDIVNKYNQGKSYNYSEKHIERLRDNALKILSLKFVDINFLLKDV
jgi:hypothetical protein